MHNHFITYKIYENWMTHNLYLPLEDEEELGIKWDDHENELFIWFPCVACTISWTHLNNYQKLRLLLQKLSFSHRLLLLVMASYPTGNMLTPIMHETVWIVSHYELAMFQTHEAITPSRDTSSSAYTPLLMQIKEFYTFGHYLFWSAIGISKQHWIK